jgi:hypothetical protein
VSDLESVSHVCLGASLVAENPECDDRDVDATVLGDDLFDERAMLLGVVGVELDRVYCGSILTRQTLPLFLEVIRAPGSQHNGGTGSDPRSDLDPDLAASAEQDNYLTIAHRVSIPNGK